MNKYLEEGYLTEEEITHGLRVRTIASEIQLWSQVAKDNNIQAK